MKRDRGVAEKKGRQERKNNNRIKKEKQQQKRSWEKEKKQRAQPTGKWQWMKLLPGKRPLFILYRFSIRISMPLELERWWCVEVVAGAGSFYFFVGRFGRPPFGMKSNHVAPLAGLFIMGKCALSFNVFSWWLLFLLAFVRLVVAGIRPFGRLIGFVWPNGVAPAKSREREEKTGCSDMRIEQLVEQLVFELSGFRAMWIWGKPRGGRCSNAAIRTNSAKQ